MLRRLSLALCAALTVAVAACGAAPAITPPSSTPALSPTVATAPTNAVATPSSPATPTAVVKPTKRSGSLLHPASTWTTYVNRRYSYASSGTGNLVDIYVPNNGQAQNPLVIFVHGGGWMQGDKSQNVGFLSTLIQMGFTVASINYRLSGEAKWPAQIEDVKCAIRALRQNAAVFRIWPDKIGLWGESAGAHLAVMAGVTPDKADWEVGEWQPTSSAVAAVQADYGVYDLAAWVDNTTGGANTLAVEFTTGLLGASVASRPDLAANASPVTWVTAGAAPVAFWHGTADPLVPPAQSQEMYEALQGAGVPTTLTLVPGMGHEQWSYYTPARVTSVGQYFDGYLRP